MYLRAKNIWCIIWNITEFTDYTFGIKLGWLFGKAIGCKGLNKNS